jgi:outer membrane cobalamin receptor
VIVALAGVIVALALGALGPVARADPAPPSSEAADAAPDPPVVELPEITVEAPRAAGVPDDPTGFTTVLRVDEHAGEAISTEELLGRAVGVQVRRFGGPGDPADISIRGSTANQVVVQLDGVRLGTAQSGGVDLSTIPLALLDRIEVSRGAGSVQAGSDAVGGVVNLVSLAPGGEERGRVIASGGDFGTAGLSFARRGTAAGGDYVLGYDAFRTRGDWSFERLPYRTGIGVVRPVPATAERINNAAERHVLLAGLDRSFGERIDVSLRDHFLYESRGMPGLDDGSVAHAGQRPDAHERRLRHLGIVQLEALEPGGLPLELGLEMAHLFDRLRFRDPDPVARLGAPIDVDDANATLTTRLRADGERSLGFSRHRLSAAFERRHDALDSDPFGDPTRTTLAWFVQDEASVLGGRVHLVPALRWDHTQGYGGEWLPRLGLALEPLSGLRLLANLERAYRAPSFDELYFPDEGFLRGNPGLRPEESTEGDVGVELALGDAGWLRDLRFQGALFHRDIDESIAFVLVSPSLVEPHNTGPATVKGFELSASLGVLGWLELSGNHTQLDATRDASGAPLPGRPERETSLRATLGPPSAAMSAFVEMHEVSEIPVSDTGHTQLPARTTWDVGAWLDLARFAPVRGFVSLRSLRAGVELTNVTDELVRDAEFFPQPGRTWMLRLEGAW